MASRRGKIAAGLLRGLVEQHIGNTFARLKRIETESAVAVLRKVIVTAERFDERQEGIQAALGMLPEERQVATAAAAHAARDELDKLISPKLAALDTQSENLAKVVERTATPQPHTDAAERQASGMRREEYRRQVEHMSLIERENVFRDPRMPPEFRTALTEGNIVLVKDRHPYVREEVAREVNMLMGRALAPDAAESYDEVREIMGVLRTVDAVVRRELESRVPAVKEPSLAVV